MLAYSATTTNGNAHARTYTLQGQQQNHKLFVIFFVWLKYKYHLLQLDKVSLKLLEVIFAELFSVRIETEATFAGISTTSFM